MIMSIRGHRHNELHIINPAIIEDLGKIRIRVVALDPGAAAAGAVGRSAAGKPVGAEFRISIRIVIVGDFKIGNRVGAYRQADHRMQRIVGMDDELVIMFAILLCYQ